MSFNRRLEQKPLKRYQAAKVAGIFLVGYAATMLYGMFKPLPENISYESDWHTDTEADILFDITHERDGEVQEDHEIFEHIEQMIAEAEDFILVDMFLYNDDYPPDMSFPELSSWFSDLLVEKQEANPDLTIVVTTDRMNSFYGSRTPEHIQRLEEAGIQVIWADLDDLRDSNVIYSGLWRFALQWFGTPKGGWLPSVFDPEAEPVTVRSYLDLLNFKANHRKLVVNEQEALVTSANPHDASAHHSNAAISVRGEIVNDVIASERAVAEMSGADTTAFDHMQYNGEQADTSSGVDAKLVTEGKIKEQLLRSISDAEAGDDLWLGMFYLSERDVIEALQAAADRGANVRLILDPNEESFGQERIGVPNRPVADELEHYSENIEVRWYNTDIEQYHTKMFYMTDGETALVNAGSTNLTRRNLDDLNLETNVVLRAPQDHTLMEEVDHYFHALWNNEESHYTDDFNEHGDGAFWKYWLYRIQESSGLSSF
ncbi:phospholipase D family protein [Natribacillus halophilus]|uniref:PLD-like domain-containing protein n=1 Tax=Natribacillus halophilus TaxID=549003 RepID=A0A1G8NUG0_9BACI|nr:phospholipase D family protein [Natribacillus halophilus]SDI83827.1 PLD-like domain-containing protein [Natribacillus halophilus]